MDLDDDLLVKVLDYIDGKLSSEQRAKFEEELSRNQTLRQTVDEFIKAESFVRAHVAVHPIPSLTQKVMSNLTGYHGSAFSIRNGLFVLAGVCAVALIAGVLLSAGLFDSAVTTVNPNEISLLSKYISQPLPSIGIDIKVIVNVVIFLNLLVGLIVLDRSVLQPLFQRRTRAMR
jgi:anti-sigma factor RsiW